MFNKCSIIIMYKKSSPRREKNLCCVLKYLKNIYDFRIIVIEQDEKSTFQTLASHYNVEYYFQKHSGIYNKSKALNFGALKANSDYLWFNDADIVLEPFIYNYCIEKLKEFEIISPYSMCFNLTISETDQFYLRPIVKIPIGRKPREGSFNSDYTNISGGCMFIRKESFWKLGGWDECFEGWGGEDDAYNHKIKKCLNYKVYNNICLHLWHSNQKNNNEIHKNDELVLKFKNMSKEKILKLGVEVKKLYGIK